MTIQEKLEELNLSPQQARLYLAALEMSPATATILAKKAGIERTASYPHLESLVKMGLLSIKPAKNKLYVAENPAKIGELIDHKKTAFKQLMPELIPLFSIKGEKPKLDIMKVRKA